MPWGALHPPWPPPPLRDPISRAGAPPGGLYKGGRREDSRTLKLWRLPLPCYTSSSSRSCLAKPCRSPAASTTTPSCCWIFINPSFLLAGSRRGRRHWAARVLNAEVPSVRHLVIGDLDHDEYDSINPVLLNASARDLQGYVDALPFPSLLDDSID